jgi:hypothetical protein
MAVLDYFPASPPTRSPQRVWLARAVAAAADVVQLGAFPVTAEGALSPIDDGLDVLTAIVLTLLVGPHLAFVPSFLVKLLPIADLAPTWTIAVLIATAGRTSDAEPLAPVPMLPAGDPGGRRIGRSAYLRATVWFAVLFVIGFAVGGAYLMPHLPLRAGLTLWQQNWAGAILGGATGLWAARNVLRRAGR